MSNNCPENCVLCARDEGWTEKEGFDNDYHPEDYEPTDVEISGNEEE